MGLQTLKLASVTKSALWSALAVTVATITSVLAVDPARAAERFALVIGNSAYERAGRLANPVRDAKLLAGVLEDLGFDVEFLPDLDEDGMGDALDLLDEKVDSVDVALFYFAGHGMQVDGRNFLVPIDAKLRSESAVEREAISLQSVINILERAKTSLVFIDACRNNPLADALAQKLESTGRGVRVLQGLATMRTSGDMLIGYATLPNSVAYDGDDANSPYTTALAKHLATPDVEVSVLMKRVTRDVVAATDGKQRPQQLSQMQTEFYFKRGADEPVRDAEATLFAAYPEFATAGDEIALFADVPLQCRPSFFDIAPSRKITPIPVRFFKTHSLGGERIRFEISPGSRFGLIVQEHDEIGRHHIGFFCQPEGTLSTAAKKRLIAAIYGKITAGVSSDRLETDDGGVLFHFASYEIQ